MSVSEIVQRLELLEEHCKIEATKVAQLWRLHEGVMAPHVVPKPPAIPTGEAAPAASGWLKEEEREALKRAFDLLCDDDGDNPLAGTVQRLLARSSPPEVVLPEFVPVEDWHTRDRKWIAAIAASGGKVKEVGK